jgi:hypothetical protein
VADEHDDKQHGEGPVPQASDDIQLELISLCSKACH